MTADFVERGQELCEKGQFPEAVKVCRLGLLAQPSRTEGRLVLANALAAMARYDEVLAETRTLLTQNPEDIRVLLLKGEALLHKGDLPQCMEVLAKVEIMAPRDPRTAALRQKAQSTVHAQGTFENSLTHSGEHSQLEDPSNSGEHSMYDDPATEVVDDVPLGFRRGGATYLGDSPMLAESPTVVPRPSFSGNVSRNAPGVPPASATPRETAIPGSGPTKPGNPASLGASSSQRPALRGVAENSLHKASDALPIDPNQTEPGRSDIHSADLNETEPGRGDMRNLQPRENAAKATSSSGLPGTIPARSPIGQPKSAQDRFPASNKSVPGSSANAAPDEPPRFVRPDSIITGEILAEEADTIAKARGKLSRAPEPAETKLGKPKSNSKERSEPAASAPGGKPRPGTLGLDTLFPDDDEPLPIEQVRNGPNSTFSGALIRTPGGTMRPARNDEAQIVSSSRPQNGASTSGPSLTGHSAPEPKLLSLDSRLPEAKEVGTHLVKHPKVERKAEGRPLDRKTAWIVWSVGYGILLAVATLFAFWMGRSWHDHQVARDFAVAREVLMKSEQSDSLAQMQYALGQGKLLHKSASSDESQALLARLALRYQLDFGDLPPDLMPMIALAESWRGSSGDRGVAFAYASALAIDKVVAEEVLSALPESFAKTYLTVRQKLSQEKFGDLPNWPTDRPSLSVLKAEAYLDRGDLPNAEKLLQEVSSDYPRGAGLRDLVALENGMPRSSDSAVGANISSSPWVSLADAAWLVRTGDVVAGKRALADLMTRPLRDPLLAQWIAKFAHRAGLETQTFLAKATAALPQHGGLALSMGELLLANGKPGEARVVLQKLSAVNEWPRARLLRAQIALALFEPEAARTDFVWLDSNMPSKSVTLGLCELDLQAGRNAEAYARVSKQMAKTPQDEDTVVMYVRVLRENGKSTELNAVWTKLDTESKGQLSLRLLLEKARSERWRKDFLAASRTYADVLKTDPSENIRYEAAEVEWALGRPKAVLAMLPRPASFAARMMVARAATKTGDFGLAEAVFVEQAASTRKLSETEEKYLAMERARLLLRQENWEAASKMLASAIDVFSPEQEPEMTSLAGYALQSPQGKRLAGWAQTAAGKSSPWSLFVQGHSAMVNAKIDAGLGLLTRAHTLLIREGARPVDIAAVAFWIGRGYYNKDVPVKANQWLKRALASDPSLADASFYLGQLAFLAEDTDAMVKHYQKACELDPRGIALAWYFLGEHFAAAKSAAKAKESLETFLKYWPNHELAQDATELLKTLGG